MNIEDYIQSNIQDLNDDSKEDVFNLFADIKVEEIQKKNLRKILELCLCVLGFKGEQVVVLQEQLENRSQDDEGSDGKSDRVYEENEKLKRIVSKLEEEKKSLKIKIKELSDENLHLQKRLHELQSSAESDKESSDPLSELDRHEELLKNINTKNKHIKRLLKDIENLQLQNIEQSKTILDFDKKFQRMKNVVANLNNQTTCLEGEKTNLKEIINELNSEVSRLGGNVTYLEEERERSDLELKEFITKLEERARTWRDIITEKEKQLESLKRKFELSKTESPVRVIDTDVNSEIVRLVEAIEDRDTVILELEARLKEMAEDMIVSTKLMNKLSAEKEEERSDISKRTRSCCKTVEESFKSAMQRCNELSEMLEKLEEDNLLKSKQTMEAINALQAYRKGEDGLQQSLRKIAALEQKLNSRDKQIKALVMEVNSFHEISQENTILRKKLNIPDDVVISTTNLKAKERSKDKLIDRLTLKLKASEENRLKLKIEKNEIKTEFLEATKKLTAFERITSPAAYSLETKHSPRKEIYCDNCLKTIETIPDKDLIVQDINREWEVKYESVIEENENLRVGMHEILERIREYDSSSDHITIDCDILGKLLHALDARSISGWYHPAMRMQNELIAVKAREQALREHIGIFDKVAMSSRIVEPVKMESINEPQPSEKVSILNEIEYEKTKTEYLKLLENHRELQTEIEKLKLIEVQFNDLKNICNASENDVTKYCSTLVEKITDLETKCNSQSKVYNFLKEDYDRTLSEQKVLNIKNITLIADLKKQINDRKHEINMLKLHHNDSEISTGNNSEALLELKKSHSKMQSQIAEIVLNIFSGEVPEFKINEISADFGIIQDNLQLDYLTVHEYDRIRNDLLEEKRKSEEWKIKFEQLEGQLQATDDQMKMQQVIISEITDNHIELRHLVADLQSTNEEKFLIAKYQNDYNISKKEISNMKLERDKLQDEINVLKTALSEKENTITHINQKHKFDIENSTIRNRFLEKSIFSLQQKYFKFTPLIFLTNFVYSYSKFVKKLKEDFQINQDFSLTFEKNIEKVLEAKKLVGDSGDLVKLVKYKTKCQYLESQLKCFQDRLISVQLELHEQQLKAAEETEHWKTIQALFGEKDQDVNVTTEQFTQTDEISVQHSFTNTAKDEANTSEVCNVCNRSQQTTPKRRTSQISPIKSHQAETVFTSRSVQSSPIHCNKTDEDNLTIISLETQLKQAMQLATMRSAVLLETENKLIEAQGRIKEMENTIETLKELIRDGSTTEKVDSTDDSSRQKASDIIETTISSFQSMLTEKGTTITHYQDLLKTEREQSSKSNEHYQKVIETLTKNHAEMENLLKSKDLEITELKGRLERVSSRRSSTEKVDIAAGVDGNGDNSLNEISDEKIEEMFKDDSPAHVPLLVLSRKNSKEADEDTVRHIQQLENQIRDAKNRETFRETSLRAKEEEISLLKEKLIQYQEREKIETTPNPEIDQLRILLEEKDKHLSDLMETLTSFHDDQQRFINETTHYSTDQISQLGADLTRSEATNKILQTQVEALRRQLNSLGQREKQSRDLANSLKTQLIKRPVVSIKTELNSRVKNENLQKRVSQLESDLETAQQEIKRQQCLIDAKRAKSATEVGLWEKQKRWQQTAEKLKTKLEETEATLEKTRGWLNAARTTINRLEKDKHMMELKLNRGGCLPSPSKCCKAPSCPNLQMSKYCPSETPETFTGESACSSPARGMHYQHGNVDLIDALKTRIEFQQRKIMVMEMEGKGSSALSTELEKLQERLSSVEAHNIRLEARNLQLQLDNDLLKQGDEGDRMKKRIKHLEDYIIALKEELARIDAQRQLGPIQSADPKPCYQGDADQTILSLRRIVEKLRAENKHLKDRDFAKNQNNSSSELSRLQHLYGEALDKISSLKIEMQLKSNQCNKCGLRAQDQQQSMIKDQLAKKTQLLEKAKILLTRAAAKEKVLKEQIVIWKRKCSELQNVPVIEEISE